MVKLKACPRCTGDLGLDRDQYGWFWDCLQCGTLLDLDRKTKLRIA